jgi:hypothetical protein
MRAAILVLFAVLCLSGCFSLRSPESFQVQRQLIRHIEHNCSPGKPCQLCLRDITSFDWDWMYVFAVGVSPVERRKVVGVDGVETSDLEGELVFTKDRRIVHQEPVPEGIEEPIKNEIWFSERVNTGQHATYSSDVEFLVIQGTSKNGPTFSLSPVR